MKSSRKTIAILVRYFSSDFFHDHEIEQNTLRTVQSIINSLDLNLRVISGATIQEIGAKILTQSQGYQNILLFHSNAPFIFDSLSRQVLERQEKFLVDYTFAEYLPPGLSPIAIRRETLGQILPSLGEGDYSPFLLDEFIKKDLNAYDIEIVLGPRDYRFLKESFFITDHRSYLFLSNIFQNIKNVFSLESFIEDSLYLLRTAPSFMEVALMEDPTRKALFQSPFRISSEPQTLSLKSLFPLLESLWEENPFLTVQFSLQDGEPCTHPGFSELLKFISAHPHRLFILETFGEGLDPHLDILKTLDNISIIFYLGATSEENYQFTHGFSSLKEKEDMAEKLLKNNPSKTYLQWVRMKENESELPSFLKRWSAYKEHIIISQYNTFAGTLPERKVADFSPLERFPCFKLLRDLYLRADGCISLCSVDKTEILLEKIPNLISKTQLKQIWDSLGHIYAEHAHSKYKGLCQHCDYWYIFNL